MTTKTELLQIIRKNCLACCGGSYQEIEKCQGGKRSNLYTTCHLHAFRFGTDPFAEVSEAKREQGRRLAESRKAHLDNRVVSNETNLNHAITMN